VSIFKEMHEAHTFESPHDYHELLRMLREATERGFVEEVTAGLRPGKIHTPERWFREKGADEIWVLTEPDERGGYWSQLDMTDFGSLDSAKQ
jgi:hypothetical protein